MSGLRVSDYWTAYAVVLAGVCCSLGCGAWGAGSGLLTMDSRGLRFASMRGCE